MKKSLTGERKSLKWQWKAIAIIILIGCMNLYIESKRPSFDVSIGTVTDKDTISYSNSIKDKKVVNNMVLALIHGETIEEPEIAKIKPNAAISINDWSEGLCHLNLKVWIDGLDAIVSLGEDEYKKISGDLAETFIEYIAEYK